VLEFDVDCRRQINSVLKQSPDFLEAVIFCTSYRFRSGLISSLNSIWYSVYHYVLYVILKGLGVARWYAHD
jgi:hypothetical protein